MPSVLHFADAHIDIASYGRRDPDTGLPLRALDFLKALDYIVDMAISEQVDLVLFCGDAYKDRTPVPTFQREWGKRMRRLSEAKIMTVLLIGNHDISPATGRAHALQEYETLNVPYIKVVSKPTFLSSSDLGDVSLQLLTLPWVNRSHLIANLELEAAKGDDAYSELGRILSEVIFEWLDEVDDESPVVFAAHASVQGAKYGAERSVMLGSDLVLPGSLVRDPRLDYTALGHIHKAQNLNEEAHPPVIYPGSIERVDFGEATDKKYFVIADIQRGHTEVVWHEIPGRAYVDRYVQLTSPEEIQNQLISALPTQEEMQDAVVRFSVEYPRECENQIDENELRRFTGSAFEFQFIRRPQVIARMRLPDGKAVASQPPLELLKAYWDTIQVEPAEAEILQTLAHKIIFDDEATARSS
jgi:DNA repair protein SbcD/Mre11